MTSQANGPPGLGLFAPFARALEVPARASSEDPLAKSLRGHTHTELMTVNPLRTPSLQKRLHGVHRDPTGTLIAARWSAAGLTAVGVEHLPAGFY